MSYIEKLRSNINKNYVFAFLKNLDLTRGIWMIYLATKGMSLAQLGILEGIFHVTSFLMEVPTGLVADIYGRKFSRICGGFFSLISIILLIFADDFYLFAGSFIFSALSYNLESGAGEALIYDSLKELDDEDKYMKVAGKQELFFQFGQVTSYILGGYLATKNYYFAFSVTIVFIVLTIIQSFTFTEPNIELGHEQNDSIRKILKKQVTDSLSAIKTNKKIGFFIIFIEIILAFGTSLFFYLQNYLKANGHTEFYIGIVFALSALAGAFTASQAFKIEKAIKEKGILIIMPILSIACVWGIAISSHPSVYYVLMMAIEGLIFVAMSDYINKLIPSKNRATILSLSSMVFSFFMIFIFPLIGKLGDMYSLNTAFKVLAISGTILALLNVFLILKIERIKQK